jgi:hypothetical protein
MATEPSLATGTGITGITSLEEAWAEIENIHDGTKTEELLNHPDQEVFDITRGWPNEGALSAFYPIDTAGAGSGTVVRGQWVQFSGTDNKVELATGADVENVAPEAPKKIMLALDGSASTTAQAAGAITVLTSNFRVKTDQLYGVYTPTGDFAIGDPVYVVDGLLTPDKTEGGATGLQVVGHVISLNDSNGTVEVEVD